MKNQKLVSLDDYIVVISNKPRYINRKGIIKKCITLVNESGKFICWLIPKKEVEVKQ